MIYLYWWEIFDRAAFQFGQDILAITDHVTINVKILLYRFTVRCSKVWLSRAELRKEEIGLKHTACISEAHDLKLCTASILLDPLTSNKVHPIAYFSSVEEPC